MTAAGATVPRVPGPSTPSSDVNLPFKVTYFGCVDYAEIWQRMREAVAARAPADADELWLLEHPPVFTLGLAGKREHLLSPGDIPVIHCDRGGQVTYHGPGQLVVYTLLDLKRLGIGPRELVRELEQAIIDTLAKFGLSGVRRVGAPGVYVDGAKIAALGLRVRNHYTYHGMALNVALDLAPFSRINPCGYAGMAVTSFTKLGLAVALDEVAAPLVQALAHRFQSASTRAANAAAMVDEVTQRGESL